MNKKTTKNPYCKPAIRVVEWDFNESICNSVVTNSFVSSCIQIDTENLKGLQYLEKRSDTSKGWQWTPKSSR